MGYNTAYSKVVQVLKCAFDKERQSKWMKTEERDHTNFEISKITLYLALHRTAILNKETL
jgi:hypothetical protein